MLHPNLEKQLGFDSPVFLFELDARMPFCNGSYRNFRFIKISVGTSRYGFIVKEDISANDIINIASIVRKLRFARYRYSMYIGQGVEEGL
jgi:phenylalanyl-tRNA synthetase beta chain